MHCCLSRIKQKASSTIIQQRIIYSVVDRKGFFSTLDILEMSDLDVYISTAFLGPYNTDLMELFQEISSITTTELLLPESVRNVYETGSADSSYCKFSDK